jgi:hypothetical protein
MLDWCRFAKVLSFRSCSSTLHANEFWAPDEHHKRLQSGSFFHFPTQMVLMVLVRLLEKWHVDHPRL